MKLPRPTRPRSSQSLPAKLACRVDEHLEGARNIILRPAVSLQEDLQGKGKPSKQTIQLADPDAVSDLLEEWMRVLLSSLREFCTGLEGRLMLSPGEFDSEHAPLLEAKIASNYPRISRQFSNFMHLATEVGDHLQGRKMAFLKDCLIVAAQGARFAALEGQSEDARKALTRKITRMLGSRKENRAEIEKYSLRTVDAITGLEQSATGFTASVRHAVEEWYARVAAEGSGLKASRVAGFAIRSVLRSILLFGLVALVAWLVAIESYMLAGFAAVSVLLVYMVTGMIGAPPEAEPLRKEDASVTDGWTGESIEQKGAARSFRIHLTERVHIVDYKSLVGAWFERIRINGKRVRHQKVKHADDQRLEFALNDGPRKYVAHLTQKYRLYVVLGETRLVVAGIELVAVE